MGRLYVLIFAAAFVAGVFASPETIGFKIVKNINKYCIENPTTIKLEPALIDSASFHYNLGARKLGDRSVNTNEYKSGKGDRPEDYQTRMNYILTEFGFSAITYSDITVEQSSGIHNVYLTSGGIGQNSISILVEANNTTYLNAKAVFYGI